MVAITGGGHGPERRAAAETPRSSAGGSTRTFQRSTFSWQTDGSSTASQSPISGSGVHVWWDGQEVRMTMIPASRAPQDTS